MSGRDEKENIPDGGQSRETSPECGVPPEKKQTLEGDAAATSTSKKASPISSFKHGSKARKNVKPTRFFVMRKEKEEKLSKIEEPTLVQQSSGSTGGSHSSMEDEGKRKNITIKRIKVVPEIFMKYLYSLEGDSDQDPYWSDEEGYVAKVCEDGTPKPRPTFSCLYFNEKSFEIYNRYIKIDSRYSMESVGITIFKTELYDINTNGSINLRMFKEIAKTLETPKKIIEGDEKCEVIVCGAIKNCKAAFLNFDLKTAILVGYLIKLAAKLNHNLAPVELKNIDPEEMYALLDPTHNEYTRLILPENYEEKTKRYRDEREKDRNAEEEREKTIVLTEDERQRSMKIRKEAAEKDSETVVFLLVDTGIEHPLHKSVVYKLSDVCEELKDIPYQATKVLVMSVNDNPEFLPEKLFEYCNGENILMAKRYRGESDTNEICVELSLII